jgi:tetratricopeptide (TPR) repeat protein
VHHFLRRLAGVSAIALLSVVCGSAQDSQPAQNAPAAPEAKKKNYKDQQEYTLYDSASKEADPAKRLQTLNTWKEKYADSDFKEERLKLYLDTYQKLGQPAKMIDTAKEILGIDPKDVTALYWITFLAPSSGGNSADALATASKAANGLLAAEKPAGTPDDAWKTAKGTFDATAYKTLGWVAMVQKSYADSEQNFKKSLQVDPKTGEVAYWLGQVLLAHSIAEKKPDMQSEALFYFARAAAYDGQGALNPEGRKKVDDYLTKAYSTLHGDTSGLADVKTLAKTNATAPADFKIKTASEIASEKEEELKKTNPELALWLNVKGQLLSPEGQQYFDSSMKGAQVPKLKGWVVKANPGVKSKELLVSMEGKDQAPNVTLKLVGADGTTAAPLSGKPELGDEIAFEGVGDSFTKDPFMVTFTIEQSKITGLKVEKVAPVVHHKKG